MGPIGQAFMSVGPGLLNKGFEYWANTRAAKKEREHDFALTEYQYKNDLDMWDRQNEYNSPVKQMERYKEAGLNPHLMYGQGNSGNAQQMPKYNRPTANYARHKFQDIDEYGRYQDVQLKQATVEGVKLKNKVLQTTVNLLDDKETYQKNAWELANQKTAEEINKLLKEVKMSDVQRQKVEKWLEEFKFSGVNIDRDGILDRELFDTLKKIDTDETIGSQNAGAILLKILPLIFK